MIGASARPPLPEASRKPWSVRHVLAILLSLFLVLYLAEAVVSFADDSLSLVFGVHVLTMIDLILFVFAALTAFVIYGLMGLTPLIPKRLFLPLALFYPVAVLATVPCLIYSSNRMELVDWAVSLIQILLGLVILYWVRVDSKFQWPLLPESRLGVRGFSWQNLLGFLLVNLCVLLPGAVIYLFQCTALAVDHYSEGFVALRPRGLAVRVRKYVRDDGKTIQLIPMAHVAEADFYQKISRLFPSNSIILMEGVTDDKNLLTNGISYKRMAATLGLSEQHEKFAPSQGTMVRADIDVDEFSPNTLELLNLAMLVHAKGVNPDTVQKLIRYTPPPGYQEQLKADLVGKRNQHLVAEIAAHLAQSDNIMVPWGAAHMPGIAAEVRKLGFRAGESKEYEVIRFHFFGNNEAHGRTK